MENLLLALDHNTRLLENLLHDLDRIANPIVLQAIRNRISENKNAAPKSKVITTFPNNSNLERG